MRRWTNINKEIRKHLDEESFSETIHPFRCQLRKEIENGNGGGVKKAYWEIRARILEGARINLALLDAAACEEQKVEELAKK